MNGSTFSKTLSNRLINISSIFHCADFGGSVCRDLPVYMQLVSLKSYFLVDVLESWTAQASWKVPPLAFGCSNGEKKGEVDDVKKWNDGAGRWRGGGGLQAQTAVLTNASPRAPLQYKHKITPQPVCVLIHQHASVGLQVSSQRLPGKVEAQTGRCWWHLCFFKHGMQHCCLDVTERWRRRHIHMLI